MGKLLVAEVGLGNTQTVVQKDAARSAPDAEFESIIVSVNIAKERLFTSNLRLCARFVLDKSSCVVINEP